MNLVRKIKISKITEVNFTEIETEIINFVNSKLDDLIPFKYEKYPKSIFYMSPEGKWLLEQDDKNDRLYVRYNNFWEVLNDKYKMINSEIQYTLKYMVEQYFEKKVSSLWYSINTTSLLAEESFKQKVSIPHHTFQFLKENVSTPDGIEMDGTLNVSTPIFSKEWKKVEQAFKEKVKL